MPETTRQRLAFNIYVDLGAGRSLRRLHQELVARKQQLGLIRVPSNRTPFEWSRRYHWQERIADIEEEAQRRDQEERVAQLREMSDRQVKEGLALQQKGLAKLQSAGLDKLKLADAIRAILEGAKLERLARDEPTEIQKMDGQVQHEIELGSFSEADLHLLLEYVSKATPLKETGETDKKEA